MTLNASDSNARNNSSTAIGPPPQRHEVPYHVLRLSHRARSWGTVSAAAISHHPRDLRARATWSANANTGGTCLWAAVRACQSHLCPGMSPHRAWAAQHRILFSGRAVSGSEIENAKMNGGGHVRYAVRVEATGAEGVIVGQESVFGWVCRRVRF